MKKLVLVGCGLVHLSLLKRLAKKPLTGTEVVLISDRDYYAYPGMLSGFLSGFYRADELYLPLREIAAKANVQFLLGRVETLHEDHQSLELADKQKIEFDLLSLNIGALPDLSKVPGAEDFAHAVMPIDQFQRSVLDFCDSLRGRRKVRIAHVGGDAVGIETVLSLYRRLRVYGTEVEILLVAGESEILSDVEADIQDQFVEVLRARGAKIVSGQGLARVEEFALIFEDGTRLQADFISWSQGRTPPSESLAWPLDRSDDGRIKTNLHLQTSASPVFASGDAAVEADTQMHVCGSQGARQAGVLYKNLRASLNGLRLKKFRMRRKQLKFVSTGEGKSVAVFGGMRLPLAAWVWNWRVARDRKFMAQFAKMLGVQQLATPMLKTGLSNDLGHQVAGLGSLVGGTKRRVLEMNAQADASGGIVSNDAAQV